MMPRSIIRDTSRIDPARVRGPIAARDFALLAARDLLTPQQRAVVAVKRAAFAITRMQLRQADIERRLSAVERQAAERRRQRQLWGR
jgi:hypothetical protein